MVLGGPKPAEKFLSIHFFPGPSISNLWFYFFTTSTMSSMVFVFSIFQLDFLLSIFHLDFPFYGISSTKISFECLGVISRVIVIFDSTWGRSPHTRCRSGYQFQSTVVVPSTHDGPLKLIIWARKNYFRQRKLRMCSLERVRCCSSELSLNYFSRVQGITL